jgi:transcriptional regulator with XRE-family HTH domain
MIDRAGLADFLRRRREQVRPSEVGLGSGGRRRTPGLRREEVAQLAGISADHYTRMEQARGSAPSASVVVAVARALRCDLDQRDHLFHLAGLTPPERRSSGHLRPGLIDLASRLTDVPVSIISDLGEPLWVNALFIALMGESARPGRIDYLRGWFLDPAFRERTPPEDWDRLSAAHVSDLRATYSRRSGDRDVNAVVADLLKQSSEFRALWERHEVAVRRSDRKDVLHPELGRICLRCEVLLTPESDVELVAFFPLEDTDAAEKIELLRVIGTQDFRTHPQPG